jgi:hypothetical protein
LALPNWFYVLLKNEGGGKEGARGVRREPSSYLSNFLLSGTISPDAKQTSGESSTLAPPNPRTLTNIFQSLLPKEFVTVREMLKEDNCTLLETISKPKGRYASLKKCRTNKTSRIN